MQCASLTSAATIADMVHHWTSAPHVKKSAEEAARAAIGGQLHAAAVGGINCESMADGASGPKQRSRIQNEGM